MRCYPCEVRRVHLFHDDGTLANQIKTDQIKISNIKITTHSEDTVSLGRLVGVPFCPDLIRYRDLGEADDLYGRVVRGFFWLLRWWR